MRIAVIGGGPAGLRAAEVAAAGGAEVTLYDAKASVGRKFLVAGRGGLNLTNSVPLVDFAARYSAPAGLWPALLADFEPAALRAWAEDLGVETFAASTGRVYPRALKAAPLLRRWVQKLRTLGVNMAMHHRWIGLSRGECWQLAFTAENEIRTADADVVILALGGGSWPETGSDGGWVSLLEGVGVSVTPLQPANCGWEYQWPPEVLAASEGQPLKNLLVRAGETSVRGELLVTRYGLEGGALYSLTPHLRAFSEPTLFIDFKPDTSVEQLVARMGRGQQHFLSEARACWRLSEAANSIVSHCLAGGVFPDVAAFAKAVKNCPLHLDRPRPLAEAISSAGGVCWSEVDDSLMLKKLPGIFVAGEMIDWEAPTGGYLLQGCFATGTRAARSALARRDH